MYIPIKFSTSKQRGDTLVEVLIAIAVVSLVLGGAFVTTNRSLSATRAAQERGVALKLAESQLEQLKALVASNPNAVFAAGAPSPFCITSGGAVVAANNAACAVGTSGTPTTAEPIFRISIERNANEFTLTERWVDVGGKNTNSLQLKYRVYD